MDDSGRSASTPRDATWHFGLVARYWAEFNEPEPDELAWYRDAIHEGGEPALDLACGTGRLLVPLIAAGLDVDGVDVSPDMLEWATTLATRAGRSPNLYCQPMDALDLPRRYRTIYCCDSFGIGGDRRRDLETFRRVRRHLEPGGVFVFSIELMYADDDEQRFARWLPGHRDNLPRPWRAPGPRERAADGDEFELTTRLVEVDPLEAREIIEIRARLWRDGAVVAEETGRLAANQYLIPELRLMLDVAGFRDISIEGRYNRKAATSEDRTVVFIAR